MLTLVDGSRYVVRESVGEIVDEVRSFRASVVLLTARLEHEAGAAPGLRLVRDPDAEPRARALDGGGLEVTVELPRAPR